MLALSLNAAPKKELNILLYGRSGSGKSTLINVFYNHIMKHEFENPRDIIIPLIHGRRFEVNVDTFKDENVQLRSYGSSQTNQIRPYKLENDEYIATFWDTPGFMDTRGEAADAEHLIHLADFLAKTPIHAMAFVLTDDDVVRDSSRYQEAVDGLRQLLPKSFFPNLLGIYNKFGLNGPAYQEGCRDSVSKLFDPNIFLPTYFMDGSTLFNDLSELNQNQKMNASYHWDRDRETTEQLLLETKTDTVLNLVEVKKIQELQQKIQEAIDEMSKLFQLVEFQNSNLKILESKKGDFSEKIQLCKAEIEQLETERKAKIKELMGWQDELRQLAMKTHPVDAYVWYLDRLLSPLKDDFTVSKEEYVRQKQVCQDWIEIYKI